MNTTSLKLGVNALMLVLLLLCAGGAHAQTSPVITSVQPNNGPEAGGTNVVIQGSGLLGATAVRFGGVDAASFSVIDDATINAVTPPGTPGGKVVQVVAPLGVVTTAASAFTYNAAPKAPAPFIDADIDLDPPGCSASTKPGFWMVAALAIPALVMIRRRFAR
ncbi:hypothetical protein BAC2_02992 [uncultured bacterium]|nr:hypothetical protein BAC2_02992 [uncultured bacterium]